MSINGRELITHFPWQRMAMTAMFDVSMLLVMQKFVDWIYYFATIDPKLTTPAVQTASITALSAAASVIFVCFAAVNIWFITGSNKTVEAMFKFNAATIAQTSLRAASQAIEEHREEKIETIEHVIDEGGDGAPERRPHSMDAIDEDE